ncbi:hypothetical protein LJ737_21905 [Hymenobacter sp. 15J16-1T3B]|uniref:hypothetical protein n=1 Tax=Hymenobacter sp. 15J16-1T3B TaxID=2886941 RepID=UPI001D128F23|nr:hypothetical protein [Hymenobacter sp. 15J16-1T3B]MCC3159911.1 hypothetical protein [Hymenobacter sp. 15J16-1T3B]
MPNFPKLARDKNGNFGPTSNRHFYTAVHRHNKSRKTNRKKEERAHEIKSIWSIKEYEQYGVFKLADEGWWFCQENEALFSIVENGTYIVGKDDEVLSYFDGPQNLFDVWHGFPVLSSNKRPSSDLLDLWEQNNIIDYATRIRIEKSVL